MSLAHDRAWWFARFVENRYGTATLKRLYVRTGCAGHSDGGTALRDVLGVEEYRVVLEVATVAGR